MGQEVNESGGRGRLPEDGQLVLAAQGGNRDAYDVLIRRYQRQAVAVSYRLLGNSQDALEVTQDAFLKGFTNLKTLQKPEAFAGWLMRIVSNLSLNYRRGRRSRLAVPLDDLMAGNEPAGEGAADDPQRLLAGREMGERLQVALGQLPEKQRLAMVMFAIQEMPQKEVAEAMDCSVEAVKWHVFQGRKKLKELLKEYM